MDRVKDGDPCAAFKRRALDGELQGRTCLWAEYTHKFYAQQFNEYSQFAVTSNTEEIRLAVSPNGTTARVKKGYSP